jgi:hypothetical protein
MATIFDDYYMPNVETCDNEAFAECLINGDEGIDIMTCEFPDVFNSTCALTNGCTI